MTKLLEQAIARLRALPAERQDEAAEFLLTLVDQDTEPVRLSPEQIAEADRRAADPALTLATDEEVETFFRQLGA